LITNAIWTFWLYCLSFIPGVRLGGIFADKQCYHNSVKANQAKWPGAYCIRLALDLKGVLDKSRAIDLTMSDAEMKKRTGYLKAAAEHPKDNRLGAIREFIGTLDGRQVFCMIHDQEVGGWRYDYGRDDSHLWHIHISFFSTYAGTWENWVEAVASVLSGETYEAWRARKSGQPEEEEEMHLVRSGATDKSVYLVPGYVQPQTGKMAAYGFSSTAVFEAYEPLYKMVQLPDGVSVAGCGLYDISPQPWPVAEITGDINVTVPPVEFPTFEISGKATPKTGE
jgi:hypothetical protein